MGRKKRKRKESGQAARRQIALHTAYSEPEDLRRAREEDAPTAPR